MGKTINYFKQALAEREGFNDWKELIDQASPADEEGYRNMAAEMFAQHCMDEGREQGRLEKVEANVDAIYKIGWNAALRWVCANYKLPLDEHGKIHEQKFKEAILRGSK